MAIWQYQSFIYPITNQAVANNLIVEEDGINDDILWKNQNWHVSRFDGIQEILPKGKSWSEDILMYGEYSSDCFEIICDEKQIVISCSFRINFSKHYERLLYQVVDFCLLNGCGLIGQELVELPLNILQIKNFIENSSSFKKYYQLLDE